MREARSITSGLKTRNLLVQSRTPGFSPQTLSCSLCGSTQKGVPNARYDRELDKEKKGNLVRGASFHTKQTDDEFIMSNQTFIDMPAILLA